MTERKTLTINKPTTPAKKKPIGSNPFKTLIDELVTIQTKSPTVIHGRIVDYENGFVTLADVSEFRRKPNDRLELEGEHESMMLDRSAIQFLAC